jgi:hypothetical protein
MVNTFEVCRRFEQNDDFFRRFVDIIVVNTFKILKTNKIYLKIDIYLSISNQLELEIN